MTAVVIRGRSDFREQDLAILAELRAKEGTPIRHSAWGTLAQLITTYSQSVSQAPPGSRQVEPDLFGCVLWMVWYQIHYAGSWSATGTLRGFLDFVRAAQNNEAVHNHVARELSEMCMFLPEPALADLAVFLRDTHLPGSDALAGMLRSLGHEVPAFSAPVAVPKTVVTLPLDASSLERDAMRAALQRIRDDELAVDRRRRRGRGWFAAAAVLGVVAAGLAVPVWQEPDTVAAGPPVATLPPFPSPTNIKRTGRMPEPTAIAIPAHGIAAYLVRLGINPDKTLEVPKKYADAGWYTGRSRPGEPGPAIIAGHYDSLEGPAVFYKLHELRNGDKIEVLLADGTAQRWIVDRVQHYAKDKFPTNEVYGKTSRPALRLITCGGVFDVRRRSYNDNVVVYAHLA